LQFAERRTDESDDEEEFCQMRILIVLALSFASSAYALTQNDFAMGLGMETRAQRDVNPDETAPKVFRRVVCEAAL